MVKPNIALDGARVLAQNRGGAQGWDGAVVPMSVTSVGQGRVEVATPHGDRLSVAAADGVYAKGSVVPVLLASDGRALRADPPGTIPTGSAPQGVGAGGEMIVQAGSDAASALADARRAWEDAKAARESITAVDSSAKAAKAVADAAAEAAKLNEQALKAAQRASAEGDAQIRAELQRKADELAKAAQEAMKAGQQAQASADGKALIAYGASQPATIKGQKVIWFKPGGVPMLYDGSVWRSVQPGDGIVPALDIGRATVGELSGMRIKAGTASVDILVMGENARWTSTGLTIYHPLSDEEKKAGVKPTDFAKRSAALDLTSDGSRFLSVADSTGQVTAFMAPTGEISGRSLMVTGAAKVDSLSVGGIALPDFIAAQTTTLAAYTKLPSLVHPSGFELFDAVTTGWVRLVPGVYNATWTVNFQQTRNSGATTIDAAGAFVKARKRAPAKDGGTPGAASSMSWGEGGSRIHSWFGYYQQEQYGAAVVNGWFEITETTEVEFTLGLHSYIQSKLVTLPSIFKVERLPAGLEVGHTVIAAGSASGTPTVTAPSWKTVTVPLSNVWYAYGTTFAQSSSYSSGGTFLLPDVKGKTVNAIYLTGKCTMDFMDGGAGRDFPFTVANEPRSATVYDYGTVEVTYGATAARTITSTGAAAFRADPNAPVYNTYDPRSFRLSVTYK